MLVNLHHRSDEHQQYYNEVELSESPQCGSINVAALQPVLAAKWAVEVINNQSSSSEMSIGNCVLYTDT